MVNILLFDTIQRRAALAPFTDTKAIATLRVGVNTILEKWIDYWPDHATFSCITANHLQAKFPLVPSEKNLYINGSFLPTQDLIKAIHELKSDDVLWYEDQVLAFWNNKETRINLDFFSKFSMQHSKKVYPNRLVQIKNKWDIFLENTLAIQNDFQRIQEKRTSQSIQDPHTILYNQQDIFIEEGVNIKAAILNATSGPIYIGKNAVIEEQAVLKGPVAICEGAEIKVGSNISHGTTIGPYSKVGGEICNSMVFEYSNKAHGGFMGNSVIGEWCNLGAKTTISNLRNDYAPIKIWDHQATSFVQTDLQFCGLFLGAYSKCGIHTMFNTGTVVEICSNLFGTGYVKRFIPAFTKGSPPEKYFIHELDQVFKSIDNAMARRKEALSTIDREVLEQLYNYYLPKNVKWLLDQPFWMTHQP